MKANERIIVALDVEEKRAKEIIELLGEKAVFYKVGLSLFFEAGEKIISFLKEKGKKIFLDLKLNDIPFQVERAVKALNKYEPALLTVHASAGKSTVEAARKAAGQSTKIIAVTVLTSIEGKDIEDTVMSLAREAVSAGADGIVCSGHEVHAFKKEFPEKIAVVPGVRLLKSAAYDQKRVVTPDEAVRNGADFIVCGREITMAENPAESFELILKAVSSV